MRCLMVALGALAAATAASAPRAVDAATEWRAAAPMPTSRAFLAAVRGPDGRIYALGGGNTGGSSVLATVERYEPTTGTWTSVAPMPTARDALAAVAGPDGRIYAIGGTVMFPNRSLGPSATVEAYDPGTGQWTSVPSMLTARQGLAAVAGPDGRIYALGGDDGVSSGDLASVEAYTPGAKAWVQVAPMPTARIGLAAVVGTDSRIYAIGGAHPGGQLATVEAYTPGTDRWASVASLSATRNYLGAAVARDGRILALGGNNNAVSYLDTAEAYTPRTGAWTSFPSMPTARSGLAAVTAQDGRVFALGGVNSSSAALSTVEAYTPPVPSPPVTSGTPAPVTVSPGAGPSPPPPRGARSPTPSAGPRAPLPAPGAPAPPGPGPAGPPPPGGAAGGAAPPPPPGGGSGPPPPPPHLPRTGESWALPSLPRPQDLALSAQAVGISLGAAIGLTLAVTPFLGVPFAGLPLPTFPSEVFDSTLDENFDRVKRWFRWLRGPLGVVRRAIGAVGESGWAASAAVALVAAALYSFLDSRFDLPLHPLAVYGGAVLGLVVITVGFRLPSALHARRRHGLELQIRALPGALAVTAVCVALSHLAQFRPGYLYGIVAGFTLAAAAAPSAVVQYIATFVLSWGAWGARGLLPRADSGWALFADQLLGMVYLAGFEAMLFGMLPLRFLDGRRVAACNLKAWLVMMGLAVFGFVHVLVMDPRSDYLHSEAAVITVIVPFAGFGLVSLAFWAHFRLRSGEGEPEAAPGSERPGEALSPLPPAERPETR